LKIKIQSVTPNPVELCAKASYISHSNAKVTDIFAEKSFKDPLEYLIKIIKMGHLSILEHAYFNILIEDAPVTAEVFAINYRLASFTVKSRRYTDVVQDGFYETTPPMDMQFLEQLKRFYLKMVDNKIPLEDARFILPYCFRTNFIMSINARELGYFLYGAIYESTLFEIREIGKTIVNELQDIFPIYQTHLELFKKDKYTLKDFNYPKGVYKPLERTVLLNTTPNLDSFYQDLLYFQKFGNSYTDDVIEESSVRESLHLSHNRALEALSFTFYLREISLAGLTHLLRHRIQSPLLGQIWTRTDYNFLVPPSIQESEYKNEFLDLSFESREKEIDSGHIYYRLVAALFPIITTMNARELIHFIKLRTCQRAQWEIRDIADEMLLEIKKVSPVLFKDMGPGCVFEGFCPEGSHTCGKIQEIRSRYLF